VELVSRTLPKTVSIVSDLEEVPPVRADLPQMHQILLNLCLNARDAMPGGGILKISTRLVNAPGLAAEFPRANAEDYVLIQVEDSGTGMDEETKRRIFEPFFTTKGPGKGSGLGLTLVYSIVANHHGFIGVDSTPAGAAFRVYLPVDTRPDESLPEESLEPPAAPGGVETILVIEDEEMLAEILAEVLTTKGYRVLSAADGEAGLRLFSEHRAEIALVLTDLGLPKLGGEEVVARIKAMDPEARIVVASGFVDPDTRASLAKAGVMQIVQKPYAYNEVLHAVRRGIDSPEALK
jgi:CheY-like chemotaxis protein